MPQLVACRPFVPKKNRPSRLPSTLTAFRKNPLAAVALDVPVAEISAWQPDAEVPAVQ